MSFKEFRFVPWLSNCPPQIEQQEIFLHGFSKEQLSFEQRLSICPPQIEHEFSKEIFEQQLSFEQRLFGQWLYNPPSRLDHDQLQLCQVEAKLRIPRP